MNNRPLIILAAIVLAICGGAIWFLQMQPSAPAPVTAPVESTPAPVISTGPTAPRVRDKSPERMAAKAEALKVIPSVAPAEWEVKIDQVLRSNVPEKETAQLLINMMPSLPAEGQTEAAQHISNLLLDEDYSRALPLLKNAALPEEVLDVFVTDLMNRDDAVKLPALLEIAKIPNHPHHEEALTDLQIFLDEDHGSDWNKWDASMKAYLKKEADENAAEPVAMPKTK